MSEISQTEAVAYKAKSIARGKLLERFRDAVQNICDGAVNEGDRAYFGSTNDLDYLKDCAHEMKDWNWDRIMREREEVDPYAVMRQQRSDIAALKAENERLRKALKGCKTHIAGFHLTDPDQASAVLSEINSELQRIHRVACAALETKP